MGGSVQRRRRRAAASSLKYERTPAPKTSAAEGRRAGKREGALGCAFVVVVVAVIVLLALTDMWWGDRTWRWAAESWPGGAYSFAVALGALLPCAFALLGLSLAAVCRPATRRARPLLAAAGALGAPAMAAVLFCLTVLIFDAQDNGRGRHAASTPPSWVYAHRPWLWALGLATTLVVAALLGAVVTGVVLARRRTERAAAGTA